MEDHRLHHQIDSRIVTLRQSLDELQRRARGGIDSKTDLVGEVFQGMSDTIDELQACGVELHRQNDELIKAREMIEAERRRYLENGTNLQAVFDSLEDFLFVLDSDGRILHVNEVALRRLGYSTEELSGMSVLEVHPPDQRAGAVEILKDLLAGKGDSCPIPLITRNGEFIPVETKVTRGQWNGRDVLIGICRDTTDRRQAELLIQVQRDLPIMLGSRLDLDEVLRIVVTTAMRISEMDCGWVYMVDETTEALDLVSPMGLPADFVGRMSHFESDSAQARLIKRTDPMYTRYRELGIGMDELPHSEEIKAAGIIPVVHQGRLIASLGVASLDKDEIPPAARIAIEAIASQAGGVIARVKSEEFVMRASEERERYRMILDAILSSIGDGILTVDRDMRVIYANTALEMMCPCLGNVHKGHLIKDIPCPCDASCFAALEQIVRDRKPVSEYRIRCTQGSNPNQTVVLNGSQLLDSTNEFQGAVLIIRDVTQLEELEKKAVARHSFGNIIGKSKRMREIYSLLESLADMESTVLLTGESGTGKELIVEALHYSGKWSSGPLVKVNCSALSEGLLESELFGHVRGAFTGAIRDGTGRFAAAEGGTIFLDEIGDISPLAQLKLLRVLEQKEFERVGESRTIKANVRVVAATNSDLQEKVTNGVFREDLFFRLKVVVIQLPPLRDRREDIPLLTDHFIRQIRDACGKNITGVSDEVMQVFMTHRWSGNVRELKYSLEHACIFCPGGTIFPKYLPRDLQESTQTGVVTKMQRGNTDVSADALLEALEKAEWKKARAARFLGISRRTIYRRIAELGIKDRIP